MRGGGEEEEEKKKDKEEEEKEKDKEEKSNRGYIACTHVFVNSKCTNTINSNYILLRWGVFKELH